jgi:hypothetical protein
MVKAKQLAYKNQAITLNLYIKELLIPGILPGLAPEAGNFATKLKTRYGTEFIFENFHAEEQDIL